MRSRSISNQKSLDILLRYSLRGSSDKASGSLALIDSSEPLTTISVIPERHAPIWKLQGSHSRGYSPALRRSKWLQALSSRSRGSRVTLKLPMRLEKRIWLEPRNCQLDALMKIGQIPKHACKWLSQGQVPSFSRHFFMRSPKIVPKNCYPKP